MFDRSKMDDQITEWHSVRPWHPTLSLAVREITSVSVTFILSCPYSNNDTTNPDLSFASLGQSSSDEDDQSRDSVSTADASPNGVVSDILSKGLSVKVNGTPWQRVFLKMDDVFDEGIIILYGLMPARQYDIELGLRPRQITVRRQVTTDTEALNEVVPPDLDAEDSTVNTTESPISSTIPLSTTPPHANGGAHTPVPPPTPFTLEDRRSQLTHTLTLLAAEHSNLTTSLKAARKDSQKADAALRSEIDTLKRASDRYAAGESRARQKILALQEAVKQTLAAAEDIEALVKDIETALPVLEGRKAEVEKEWLRVKDEAEQAKMRRAEAEQKETARAEAMQIELAGLANKLDKLSGKREKLEGEGGVISALEEKLRKLEEERERIERDPYGYEGEAGADSEDSPDRRSKDDSSPEGERAHHSTRHPNHHGAHPHFNNFHPQQHVHPRKRHSHPHMHNQPHAHHHPRPSFPPPRPPVHTEAGQRPSGTAGRASFPIGANAVPGVIHLPPQGHPHRKNNPTHAHAHAPHRSAFHAHPHTGGIASGTSSSSSTPAASVGPATGLSSRAPPFEPARSRTHSAQGGISQGTGKSELNPGSTPFAPRTVVAQAITPATSGAPGRVGPAA
ncbi:hypothetical protein C8Q79DRAFT_677715 [Trametes meyenii]|nr:hypothetical protein C8Q79DRAFT_677715 [Trametes meyenii]